MTAERIHHYEIEGPVPRGGMGRVFRARVVAPGGPLPVGTDVQLRVLTEAEAGGAAVFALLEKEHKAAAAVTQAAVAAPLDFGVAESAGGRRFWSVSAWVEGRTLTDFLAGTGTLPDPFVDAIAKPAADALRALHGAGLRAIGLSPDMLLVKDDTSVLLLDPAFGAAHAAVQPQAGPLTPSLACAAPEAIRSRDHTDERADLYSLGATLFRAMTGRWHRPDDAQALRCEPDSFEARRPSDVHPRLSILLDELVFALLQCDLTRRIASSEQLGTILEQRRESAWWRSLNIAQESYGEVRAGRNRISSEPPPPPIPAAAAAPDAAWVEAHRARGLRIGRHVAPIVGRDDELHGLVDVASRLVERGGRVRLVQGDAGSGKTRLADALLDALERLAPSEQPLVLVGEHRRLGIGRPMRAFNEGLTRLVSESRDVTEAQIAPLLGEAAAIAPAFAAFLSGSEPPPRATPLTRDGISAAFSRALASLCAVTPVVVVIENLHWAEPEGLDLFEQFARLAAGLPLLLVGTFQPVPKTAPLAHALASLRALDHVATVKLGALTESEALQLALCVVTPDSHGVALGKRVAASCEGSAWRVVETLRLFEAEGTLVRDGAGRLCATARTETACLPETGDHIWKRRLALLGAPERAVLAMAAVQGFVFDADVVRLALGLSAADIDRALATLVAGGLVEGTGPGRRFCGNPLFDHVHDALDDAAFASCHQATATAFLASRNRRGLPPSETHGILSYRVAWHYLLGGSVAPGLLYVPAAIRHLRSTWRLGDATRLAEIAARAISAEPGRTGELIDMQLTRAEFLRLQGGYAEEREVVDDALLRARAAGDASREAAVLLESARVRFAVNELPNAVTEAREALAAASRAGSDRVAIDCQSLLGAIAFRESRYQEARNHVNETLEIARRRSDVQAEAQALHTLGDISQGVGSFEHAEELHTTAMRIYRREGDLAREAEALSSLGDIAAASGDLVKAEGLLRRALALVRSVGDGGGEARVLGRLGMVLQEAQRCAEARAVHVECLNVSRRINARENEVVATLNLATVDFVLGRVDDARACYGDAMRTARDVREPRLMGYALTGLGEVARQNGEGDIARGLFDRAVTQFRRCGDQGGLAAALLGAGRIEVLGGDAARARGFLTEARDLAVLQNARYAGALALAYLSILAARRGDSEEALAAMVESGAMVEGVRAGDAMRIELLFLHALVLRVLGRKVEGDRKLLRAEALLLQSTAEMSREDRERVFSMMSPHREILAGANAARASSNSREKDPSGTVAV